VKRAPSLKTRAKSVEALQTEARRKIAKAKRSGKREDILAAVPITLRLAREAIRFSRAVRRSKKPRLVARRSRNSTKRTRAESR